MKHLSYVNSFGKRFSHQIMFILIITCMIACNNKGTGGNNNNDTAANESNSDTSQKQLKAMIGTSQFSVLAIDTQTLKNIFILPLPQGGYKSRKIVFRFAYGGNTEDKIVLTGFPTRNNNNTYLPPFDPKEVPPLVTNLQNQKIYLSDLELEIDKFQRLWARKGNNSHLLLTPFVHTSGTLQYCVSYNLNWITLPGYTGESFVPDDQLNPSPPADPS